MANIDDLNDKVFALACAIHGLDKGDTRALATYEMIKQFLVENDFAVEFTPEQL